MYSCFILTQITIFPLKIKNENYTILLYPLLCNTQSNICQMFITKDCIKII